jgi:hypothetical protein
VEVVQRESAWPGGWVLMSTIYAVRTGETERVLTGTVPAVKVKAGRMSSGHVLVQWRNGICLVLCCFLEGKRSLDAMIARERVKSKRTSISSPGLEPRRGLPGIHRRAVRGASGLYLPRACRRARR